MKKPPPLKNAHTSNSKMGMGDSYGSAFKNKIGSSKELMAQRSMTAKQLKKPPKSLA